MKRIAFLVVVSLLTSSLVFAQGGTKSTEAGKKAAQAWLALVDKGDYAGSYDQASSTFKASISKEQWQKALSSARGPLGKVLSRDVKKDEFKTTMPGAPNGQYVFLQFNSSFDNKKDALETIIPMLDKDGQWRVSGYFIR